jgi:hypothetical protein
MEFFALALKKIVGCGFLRGLFRFMRVVGFSFAVVDLLFREGARVLICTRRLWLVSRARLVRFLSELIGRMVVIGWEAAGCGGA